MHRTLNRKERLAIQENIPGSLGWRLKKEMENGMKFQRTICRNSLKFTPKKTYSKINFYEHAIERGWELDTTTMLWSHEQYKDRKFPSIYQMRPTGRLPVPFANNQDEKGLAYNISLSCAGQESTIRPNRWLTLEFDTRRGRRKIKWEQKKKDRALAAKMFLNYDERERFENADDEDEYKEFIY